MERMRLVFLTFYTPRMLIGSCRKLRISVHYYDTTSNQKGLSMLLDSPFFG